MNASQQSVSHVYSGSLGGSKVTASDHHDASCTSSLYSSQNVSGNITPRQVRRARNSASLSRRSGSKVIPSSTRTQQPADATPAKKRPAKPEAQCCSTPLSLVFGVGCVAIAAVFTIITVLSSVTFNSQVESSVKENLGTAMQGAMKYITDPLVQSQQYAQQLKDMIEADPAKYACDDSVLSFPGNTSTQNFLFEAGMYGLQHPNVQYIYQSRLSKRYLRSDGLGPAGICCMIGAAQKLVYYMINNTQHITPFTNSSYFASLATQVPATFQIMDITSFAIIRGPATTPTSRWISDSINIASAGLTEPTNKYSYILHVNDPNNSSDVWAIGMDHTTATLKNTLLQATPPITVGQTNVKPTQTDGAHTTLYDLNENLIMASTHPNVPIAKEYGVLFTSGQSPAANVNAAYFDALSRCGTSGCTNALVTIGKSEVQTAYIIDIPESKLHLLMVSSVPRKFFFANADQTFATTLGLSIGCCVLIIAGCVALLMMIRNPLSKLKENMLLAAELHNDRVEHTSTYLSEILALSAVFDGMNQQLLIARSFVPEAVLLGKTDDSHDADDEGSVMDATEEKSTLHSKQRSSVARGGGGLASSALGAGANETIDGTNVSKNSSNGISKLFNVAEKRVGVLSLNLVGFHALCAPERTITRARKINDISTSLLTIAVACSHRERGVMDSFHGDHFTLTFNASRAVAGPLAAAVRTANNFIFEVSENAVFWPVKGVAAGAAAGKAHVGTFGIDGYRRMSVVGDVYRAAIALQHASVQFLRINEHLGIQEGCMVEESAVKELGNCAIHLHAVGCIQSSEHRRCDTPKAPPVVFYALDAGANKETLEAMKADGEWLYELDAIESADPYHEPNRAMQALVDGDMELCRQILDSHIADLSHRRSVVGNSPTTRNIVSSAVSHALDDSTSSAGGGALASSKSALHDQNPAWSLVNHYYSHMMLLADGPLAATSVARHCNIPHVFFQQ